MWSWWITVFLQLRQTQQSAAHNLKVMTKTEFYFLTKNIHDESLETNYFKSNFIYM